MSYFLNNRFLSNASKEKISIDDRGFTLGDGVFETMMSWNGNILFYKEHFQRLKKSASFFGISLEKNVNEVRSILDKLIQKNHLQKNNAIIRITLTRGPAPRGLLPDKKNKPTFLIKITKSKKNFIFKPLSASVCEITSRDLASPLNCYKTVNYLNNIIALKDAKKRGFDESIILNSKGRIACVSTANIFIIKNKKIITPPISEGVLPGTVRNYLLKKGLASEAKITINDLLNASESFITNSIALLRPISYVGFRSKKKRLEIKQSFKLISVLSKILE